MVKRINDALPGLVLGIVFYGIVVQLIGLWFVTDKISYSIGLWYGIAIAVGIAVNIATVIYDATAIYGQKDANRRIVAKSLLRYIVVAVLLFILGLFGKSDNGLCRYAGAQDFSIFTAFIYEGDRQIFREK